MKTFAFLKIQSLMLVTALMFGQVGAGFLHNKHDAHQSVADLDHTVLVNHGEHCKVCAVDWVHQFLASNTNVELAQAVSGSAVVVHLISSTSSPRPLTKDRAPPVAC